MSGTTAGGRKARETNYKKYGKDFYSRIGAKGGRNGHTGGFAADRELASRAGTKGGKKSKRGPAKKQTGGVPKKAPSQRQLIKLRIEELEGSMKTAGFLARQASKREIASLKKELEKL